MGQAASLKFGTIGVCSSSTTEEEEFQPHHPRFAVTAEVPNSKPGSLQPNRYSESNRSFQSLAKESSVLDLVSPPFLCPSRRPSLWWTAFPVVGYPGLIAKHFDSVSQHRYPLPLLHHHLHDHQPQLQLQCKDTPSLPSTRRSSSILSTSS